MDPKQYQELAARTECDQSKSRVRMTYAPWVPADNVGQFNEAVRLNHAIIGMTGEVGELAGALEKCIYYGKDLDRTNIAEEIGDVLWYLAQACNVLGLDLGTIMESNIAKLRQRYPDKYSDLSAAEENRDRGSEAKVVEAHVQNGRGWAEPPLEATQPDTSTLLDKINKMVEGCVEAAHKHDELLGRPCGEAKPVDGHLIERAVRQSLAKQHPDPLVIGADPGSTDDQKATTLVLQQEPGEMVVLALPAPVQLGEAITDLLQEKPAGGRMGHTHPADKRVRPPQVCLSHLWRKYSPIRTHSRCIKCGAYSHLGSGFMPCPVPDVVEVPGQQGDK